jgi:hypothetical protein
MSVVSTTYFVPEKREEALVKKGSKNYSSEQNLSNRMIEAK